MRIILLFIVYFSNAQGLLAQSSEQNVQELAQEMIGRIENLDENSDLLADIQGVLQPHSDFLSNTLAKMQTDPEFEPYIERYESLKSQYMGHGQYISIHPDIKIFLSAAPFSRSASYDESLIGKSVCFNYNSVIIVDRGFWEYYRGNDEAREAVLFHELGHCDLRQEHGHNGMMDRIWMDDLLNGKTIDWQSLYEEFFVAQQPSKVIVCSEENSHFYEECFDPRFIFQPLVCREKEDNTLCYAWREVIINEIKNSLPFMECLLFNPNSSTCFDPL